MEKITESFGKLTVESKISRECIQCDGPDCTKSNPPNRCSRCKGVYYCSKQCQKEHWIKQHKETCISDAKNKELKKAEAEELEEKYDAFIAKRTTSTTSSTGADTIQALNTECCICLADPITNDPVVLNTCRHAFCRPCLLQWQIQGMGVQTGIGKNSFLHNLSHIPVPPKPSAGHETSRCPLCKANSADDVYFNALTRAGLYQARADAEGTMKEDRTVFLSKAVEELDKILLGENVRGLFYYERKARMLVELKREEEALECLRFMSEINDKRKKRSEEIRKEIREAMVHGGAGVNIPALHEELKQVSTDQIPPDRFTNSTLMLIIADAYMSMKKWGKAYNVLHDLERDQALLNEHRGGAGLERIMHRLHDIDVRLAECLYGLKDYNKCIEAADRAIGIHRAYQRTHKWKALALRAKGKVDEALTCINRAILYEAPGDLEVYQENIGLYNDFAEKGCRQTSQTGGRRRKKK